MQIDHSFRKDILHPPRWGYQSRGNVVPSSIIIHTTSNKRATQFTTEAAFLRDSKDVSAHYLIGKDGRIVQFLDPKQWQAWHAGTTLPAYLNARSVGIEHHVSVGEPWTPAQHAACTWLVRQLMSAYGIPLVDTHRAVALPKGRKVDPEGWNDAAFYAWRATLAAPVLHSYRAVTCAPVFQDRRPDAPLALTIAAGVEEPVDDVTNGWIHLFSGAGFSPLSCWERL